MSALATAITSGLPDLLHLIGQDAPLTRRAAANGGEYAGPCPFCGGVDRFWVWPAAERPGWWCRRCERSGDMLGYLALRSGRSRAATLAGLGLAAESSSGHAAPLTPPEPVAPPPERWRAEALRFVTTCYDRLWSPAGAIARRFLETRYGLDERHLVWGMLGYNDRDRYVARAAWGWSQSRSRTLMGSARRAPSGSQEASSSPG